MEKTKLCYVECPFLFSRQEDYDDEPMGYCSVNNTDKFIGSMDNIRTNDCYCVNKA